MIKKKAASRIRLPITAMQKQYYRSAEMMCPRCGNLYDVNNILVLRNAFEKTRKQIYATVQH